MTDLVLIQTILILRGLDRLLKCATRDVPQSSASLCVPVPIDRQALLRLVLLIDQLTAERGEAWCPVEMGSPQSPVWPKLPESVRAAVVRLLGALASPATLRCGEIGDDRAGPAWAWGQNESKIRPEHQDRLAVVYVRQSSRQQVLEHTESTRLQDALIDRHHCLARANQLFTRL